MTVKQGRRPRPELVRLLGPERKSDYSAPAPLPEDLQEERRLRPLRIDEFVGQGGVKEQLRISLDPTREDFPVDIMLDRGPSARSLKLNLEPFTLVGATTRSGLLSAPLRSRFGVTLRLDYYGAEDLARIVRRSAGILVVEVEESAALEIARRARGTPRIANRLLRRVRDFAFIKSDGRVTLDATRAALTLLAVDERGLDE